jgi:hypothetical protein
MADISVYLGQDAELDIFFICPLKLKWTLGFRPLKILLDIAFSI